MDASVGHESNTEPVALPPRIWVVGPCGAGKSAVARKVAENLGIAATHLDEIHWQPGWNEATPEEEAARVAAVVKRDSWVIDGNYADLRATFADHADLFVWLDLPLRVTFFRILKRTLRRSFSRELCCNGNRESLWMSFCTRDSILLWSLTRHRWRRTMLTVELDGHPAVRLRTPEAVQAWLRRL